jgi:hypothetical protein
MTYYRGMGATPRRYTGLHGLGMDETERIRRNGVAESLARKWDNNALNYLRARSNYIPSFQVPAGAPYEPEGGVVSGWATSTARTDAAQRHQNVVAFLAWSAPPPPNVPPVTTTPTAPQVPGGGHVPPPDDGAQPLPQVTILGTPDAPPVALLALAVVAAFLVFSPRSRGA